MQCVVFEIAAGASRDTVLQALSRDPRVALAQPLETFGALNAPGQAAGDGDGGSGGGARGVPYNDPYLPLQRGFADIGAAEAQRWSRGADVRVAVIDSGVDLHHPDLAGRIALAENFAGGDVNDIPPEQHGTEVAGIIAADADNHLGIVGVAPLARVLVLRACWPQQPAAPGAECNSFTLAKALSAAIQAHADVINLSLGGPPDPLLTQLLEYGLRQGIIVVGAVPPGGAPRGFPVDVAGVLPVAASGTKPDTDALYAPGREVLTLTPGGHYDFASGSSMAAAQVSGTVALLLARDGHLTPAQALATLRRSSRTVADGDARGPIINACTALSTLAPGARCIALASAAAAPPRPAAATPRLQCAEPGRRRESRKKQDAQKNAAPKSGVSLIRSHCPVATVVRPRRYCGGAASGEAAGAEFVVPVPVARPTRFSRRLMRRSLRRLARRSMPWSAPLAPIAAAPASRRLMRRSLRRLARRSMPWSAVAAALSAGVLAGAASCALATLIAPAWAIKIEAARPISNFRFIECSWYEW
jgi:hypothetical protein